MFFERLLNKLKQHGDDLSLDAADAIETLSAMLATKKSADPEPGRWLPKISFGLHVADEQYGHIYRCSVCGGESIGMSKFCPNCGKPMGGL